MRECQNHTVFLNGLGQWMARLERETAGPFADRDMALQVAVADAFKLRRENRGVRLVLLDAGGSPQADVCLCREFDLRNLIAGLRSA